MFKVKIIQLIDKKITALLTTGIQHKKWTVKTQNESLKKMLKKWKKKKKWKKFKKKKIKNKRKKWKKKC